MLAGHPPGWLDTLDLPDLLDVLLAAYLQRIEAQRGWKNDSLALVVENLATAPFALREEWGVRPDHAAAQREMMRLAGGPAPMRQDGARPQPRKERAR
jgi:hypothetical protein